MAAARRSSRHERSLPRVSLEAAQDPPSRLSLWLCIGAIVLAGALTYAAWTAPTSWTTRYRIAVQMIGIASLAGLTLAAFRWRPRIAVLGALFFLTLSPSTDEERPTYEAWLARPDLILAALSVQFETILARRRLGKLVFVGRPLTVGGAAV